MPNHIAPHCCRCNFQGTYVHKKTLLTQGCLLSVYYKPFDVCSHLIVYGNTLSVQCPHPGCQFEAVHKVLNDHILVSERLCVCVCACEPVCVCIHASL